MAEIQILPDRLASTIPYFFYDLFGRIFPGIFFLGGVLVRFETGHFIWQHVEQLSTGALLLAGAVLVSECFMIGYLIDGLGGWFSHWMPLKANFPRLRHENGGAGDEVSPLEVVFKRYFGFPLERHPYDREYIDYCARQCGLAVCAHDPALDRQLARIDAEELLGRSLTTTSVILFLLNLPGMSVHLVPLLVYACVFGVSLNSFVYYRAKVRRERFYTFVVLFCGKQGFYGDPAASAQQ